MKQFGLVSIIACCLFLQGCFNINPKGNVEISLQDTIVSVPFQGVPTIDLTKKYPVKDFLVDENDKEFIPLETTKDVLADKDFRVRYISDNYIVGVNGERGDIFIFDRNGKIVSHFNHKGNSGIDYLSINSIVFDEKREEIFVADYLLKNRCAVYSSIDGKFLRQFYFPPKSWITELYNFDDETLLAYNGHHESENYSADEINQRMPFVFLSKKDGSILSRLDISFPKRVSDKYRLRIPSGGIMVFGVSAANNVKYGQDFIIADRSSDTIFLLTQDKNLTPLFVRTPSVFDEKNLVVMGIHFKTDRYLFFNTFTYDWNEIIAQYERGQPKQGLSNYFAYDMYTGQVFSVEEGPTIIRSNIDAPKNTTVYQWLSDVLVEDLKNGKLDGKLKLIAETLDEEDNPVVELTKYLPRFFN